MTSEDIKQHFTFTSSEARWLTRDAGGRPRRGEWGESVSGSALARARSDPVEFRTILLYVHRSEVAYFRDGVRRRKSEGSTADTTRKRPERPWTAARTMEVLRRCPVATAVSTAVLGQHPLPHCC